jgi:hypothetical protein
MYVLSISIAFSIDFPGSIAMSRRLIIPVRHSFSDLLFQLFFSLFFLFSILFLPLSITGLYELLQLSITGLSELSFQPILISFDGTVFSEPYLFDITDSEPFGDFVYLWAVPKGKITSVHYLGSAETNYLSPFYVLITSSPPWCGIWARGGIQICVPK